MIRISIPADYIPDDEKHEVEVPIYVKGQFVKFNKNKFVSLTFLTFPRAELFNMGMPPPHTF